MPENELSKTLRWKLSVYLTQKGKSIPSYTLEGGFHQKSPERNERWRGVEGLLRGMQNGAATVKNTTAVSQKLKDNSSSGCVPKRLESRYLNRCLHTTIYSSITHCSQKVATVHMFTKRWMDTQNAVYAQWNVIQPHKEVKFWHTLRHEWT